MRSACTTEFSCCCIKFAFFSCPKNAFSLLLQHGFNWQQNILKLWFLALWLWFLFPTDLSQDATTLLLITLYHRYMDMHACMYVCIFYPARYQYCKCKFVQGWSCAKLINFRNPFKHQTWNVLWKQLRTEIR